MCTVTIVPHDRGVRIACNRDERRSRPAAMPPKVHVLGRRLAAFPVDPAGGGTWIGVNDAHIAVMLLNRSNPGQNAVTPPRSRGLIVPHVLQSGSLREALDVAMTTDVASFAPFHLVLVQGAQLAAVVSDGRRLFQHRTRLTEPMLFTSSSLGDALVEPPRRRLFERMVIGARSCRLDAQARFHRHRWRLRPELSVRMTRKDARTVSRTIVDLTTLGSGLLYEELAGSSDEASSVERRGERPLVRRSVRAWCSLL